ncbi:hypothetical protein BJX66DRAFT_339611 [Aspergillus keveii]|uniref:Uncharacterized protein n=1 Tax=Aspergillus keveii TaxID=714993 RepID=A0ABR4G0Z9_9EURO
MNCLLTPTKAMGNAKIEGLQEALNPMNSQYNVSPTIFFIPYTLFEAFTNVLLKHMGPKLFIPSIMLTWGTVVTLMGLLQNFSGLMAAR